MAHEVDGSRCEGKVALVTGASRGIGAAIAERLATEGAAVACAARTLDPDPRYHGTLNETVERIEGRGGRAAAFQCDLSDADSRADLIAEVTDTLGGVDILVNNAAVTFFGPIDSFPKKRFDLMVDVQLWASLDLAQRVIPHMREAGGGAILNITSRAGANPIGPPYEDFYSKFGSTVYGIVKAGLDRLTTGMAAELLDDGISVNALAPWDNVPSPGATDHDLIENYRLEPVELIAQAAVELIAPVQSRQTGRIAYSQPLLQELGASVKTLDGQHFTPEG